MSNSDCVILMPCSGVVEPETEAALFELTQRGYPPVHVLKGGSQIDLARSLMATEAYGQGFKETLWIDADVAFDPDDVDRMRALDLPIVCGLYPKKGQKQFACQFLPGTEKVTMGAGGGLLEVKGVGMGFTLIRREVYEKLGESLPTCGGGYDGKMIVPYFLPMVVGEGDDSCYMSEDYSFCLRARAAGFKVMADTRIKLGHIGKKKWSWDDFLPQQVLETLVLTHGEQQPEPTSEGDDMTQADLYAKIGQLQMEKEQNYANYQTAMNTLANVLAGSLKPSCVGVDLTNYVLHVSNNGEPIPQPAKINGLPNFIVGKADPVPEAKEAA